MSIMETRACPRKAFLHSHVSPGIIKASALRKIAKEIILTVGPNINEADLNKAVEAAFAASTSKMFGFEKESECMRMKVLLWRYLQFEKTQKSSKILAQDFINKVKVLGKECDVTAHRLIDRGSAVECIRYIYKAPDMNYNGRSSSAKPENNPDLLALQRCGEAELKKLGVDKPVFGSFYYIKSKKDRSRALAPNFEASLGDNIINHHFTMEEENNLATFYKDIKEDATKMACDERECADCIFNDLCHLEFDKRSLAEMPTVEETPLDSIHMTKAQTKFVLFEDGQCRVNAVAGSGKTTIVTLRTLRLIEEGCRPDQILMITFTDKAKAEMQTRLRRYAKGTALKDANIDTSKIVVETFNSFGQNLLDKYYDKLGFTSAPALVDEVVKKDIIVSLLETHRTLPLDYRNPFLDMRNATGAVIQIAHIIDAMKANHVETPAEAEEILGGGLQDRAAELLSIYQAYNAKLVENNMIDYEDQLRLILKLEPYGVFADLPYQHIVVDEFQDSDPNQINLIMEMAKADKNLKSIVVVGDELQAIYGFRNANPENLVNFGEYFPGMIDIPMEDNFRSQSPIIALANKIVDKEARIAKIIRANRKEKGLDPVIMQIEKEDDEHDLYLRQVQKLLKNGTPPKDIAILCRSKKELLRLQKRLDDAGVPTVLRVPEIIADAPYVKTIIGLASFLLDHKNLLDFALYRKSLGQDPFDSVALEKDAEELAAKYDALETDGERILFFTGMIEDAKGDYIAKDFADKLMSKGFHTSKQILEFCVKYKTYGIKETISTAREDVDAVTLITVHSAKGLEWPVVLLSLRTFRPVNDEEHRLLYVAITRAKEKLLVTYTKKQSLLVSLLN